jgi:hypothetical protein
VGILRRLSRLVAVAVVAMTVVVGCSSSGGTKPGRGDVEGALAQLSFPISTIRCATDRIFSRLSGSELRQIVDQARQGPEQVAPKLRQALADALRPCVAPSTSTTTALIAPTGPSGTG